MSSVASKKKIAILLLVLSGFVAGAVSLQVLLSRSLTRFVRNRLLPEAAATLGARVELDRLCANLWRTDVQAEGLRFSSPSESNAPPVVSLGHGRLNFSVLPLLRGVIRIKNLHGDDLVVTLSRDRAAGGTEALQNRLLGKPAVQDSPAGTGESRSNRHARVRIDRLDLQTVIQYLGSDKDGAPDPLKLKLRIKGSNLATYDTGGKEGQIQIEGHLAEDPGAFVVNLRGTVGALAVGATPDFSVEGSVEKLDVRRLETFSKKTGIEGDSASIGVRLVCRSGMYQAGSQLKFRVLGARFSQKRSKKGIRVEIPPDFALAVPVGGTVHAPELDFTTGILQGLLTGFSAPQEKPVKP